MSILFNELPILETTKQGLETLGFTHPTPIQALAIPTMIEGHDLIGQAQTGTGKTFAFGIPMIEKINTNEKMTQALIVCPTRELATQVYKEMLKLVKFYTAVKVALIVGGESYDKQFQALKRRPHLIIATPGRMIDHMERKTLDLSTVQTLALDEADEMLKMGFQEAIETIMKNIHEERQIVLFSATMPSAIKKIARTYQHDPKHIKIESDTLTVDLISQFYYIVKKDDKTKLLKRIFDMKNPDSAIVFANTKADVDRITEQLINDGYKADALHGDLRQRSRSDVMKRFREKKLSILVGTDVAARGLDIDDIDLVVNYDLPHEQEVYVHRIGRTGRAGKTGLAYAFVTPRKQHDLRDIESYTNAKIKYLEIPSIGDVREEQFKTIKETLSVAMEKQVDDHLKQMKDLIQTAEDKDVLLNVLLDRLLPQAHEYDQIETINPKKERNHKSSQNNTTRRSNDYVDYVINIGRRDGITPPKFLQLMDKKFDIFQKNIGDIKHEHSTTVFGVKKNIVNRMKTKQIILDGRRIYIKPFK